MKFLFTILFAVMLLLLGAQGVSAALEVDFISSNPSPAQPGATILLQFRVENTGSEPLQNVTFLLETDDDLFLVSPALQTLPLLEANAQRVISYQVATSNDASGEQGFEITFGAQSLSPRTEDFEITVTTSKDILVVRRVTATPSRITPGGTAQISIEIENVGEEEMSDVFIRLDLSGDLPFAPRESSTERRIGELEEEDLATVTFPIYVLATADEQIYKIPVRITYKDEFGETFTKSDLISLSVGTEPVLEVGLDSTGFIEQQRSSVAIKIVNAGLGDTKFVSVKLLPGSYDILSPDQVYLGNIDSDDFQTADFELVLRQDTTLNLELRYKDASNRDYLQSVSIPVKVYTRDEARELGLVQSNTVWIIVLGIILMLILLWIFRRVLRRKGKE